MKINPKSVLTIDPREVSVQVFQRYLQEAIVPRPIAFASTIDRNGNVNLSPFSFFNIFSSNPPVLVFSPSRRGRDNLVKHTLENIREIPEVVINIVSYAIVQQASLSSTEYPKGINEFNKSGLTPVPSAKVRPPRVLESPVSFECKVNDIIPLGDKGGAGNLVICEVLFMQIQEEVLDEEQMIDPFKLDAVARMGDSWYCRAQGEALFKVPKPLGRMGIGVDGIPEPIRRSKILTGNDLGLLGNTESLPDDESIAQFSRNSLIRAAIDEGEESRHKLAQEFLRAGDIQDAWKVLLASKVI
jgi:flavin reductase (DIM6/NTAB) family NADH-FMN oxidoreductase RutF